jgi:hypothetical protein
MYNRSRVRVLQYLKKDYNALLDVCSRAIQTDVELNTEPSLVIMKAAADTTQSIQRIDEKLDQLTESYA